MKYLLLGRDTVGNPPLWDEFEGPSYSWPVKPPSDLKEAFVGRNERMGAIVRTPEMHRASDLTALLNSLNKERRSLANPAVVRDERRGKG
jgi:hypothetical protein